MYFFKLENAKTLKNFELDVDPMFLVILCMTDTMHGAANKMRSAAKTKPGVANMMHGVTDVMHVSCGG